MNRILWADQSKTLAIFLMVLCHYGLSNKECVTFIYMFHMPIFFFISGYFDKGRPFSKELLKKNFKKLMVPYFFFSFCALSICWVSPYIHPDLYNNDGLGKTFVKAIIGTFLMEDRVRTYAFMPFAPLWFLVSLFEVRIIFALFVTICKRIGNISGIIGFTIIFFLGICCKIPFFSLNSAAMAIPIYISGYLVKRFNLIEYINNIWYSFILFALGIIYLLLIGMKNGLIEMNSVNFGNSIIMFYINSIIGSLTFIYLFKALNVKWGVLSVVGASTLTILGTHGYINIIGRVVGIKIFTIDFSCAPIWYSLSLTLLGIALGVFCHNFLMKYIPVAIGKK